MIQLLPRGTYTLRVKEAKYCNPFDKVYLKVVIEGYPATDGNRITGVDHTYDGIELDYELDVSGDSEVHKHLPRIFRALDIDKLRRHWTESDFIGKVFVGIIEPKIEPLRKGTL